MQKFYVVCNNSGRVFHRVVTDRSMAEVLKAVEILYGSTRLLTVLTEEEYNGQYWTTRDNRKLNVNEITDVNHLQNILKMFMRRDRSTVEKYNALVDKYNALNGRSFVSLNGDMAQFFNDQQLDRVYDPNPDLPW